jgi:hypothetical protein
MKNDFPLRINVINIRNNLSTFVTAKTRRREGVMRDNVNDSSRESHLNFNEIPRQNHGQSCQSSRASTKGFELRAKGR